MKKVAKHHLGINHYLIKEKKKRCGWNLKHSKLLASFQNSLNYICLIMSPKINHWNIFD